MLFNPKDGGDMSPLESPREVRAWKVPVQLPDVAELTTRTDPIQVADGTPSKWSPREAAFLLLVKAECANQLAAAPPYYDAYGDRRLLRFLRHHKTEHKALAAVKAYLIWRETSGANQVRAVLCREASPRKWPFGNMILDRSYVLPCSVELFDKKGNALCVERYGLWPAEKLRDVCADDYLAWQAYCLEWKSIQLERISIAREREGSTKISAGWGEIARLCTVFDLAGLTLAHALLPTGFRMIKRLIPIVQQAYPWLQDTTHLVNAAPSMAAVWGAVKPLLPAHTKRKIQVHADLASLRSCISPAHLPAALGGDAPCVDSSEPSPTSYLGEPTIPALESSSSSSSFILSSHCRDLIDHLRAGGSIPVYRHTKRSRSRRYLSCADDVLALSSPARRGFFFSKARPTRLARSDVYVALGGGSWSIPRGREAWQVDIDGEAAALPTNFAVLATPRKCFTLELESDEEPKALGICLGLLQGDRVCSASKCRPNIS